MFKNLPKETHELKELKFVYETDSYYDISIRESGDVEIKLERKAFEEKKKVSFTDRLYEPYFENAEAAGYYEGDECLGIVEVNHETWSNRLRITEILVYMKHRGKGVGTKLIDYAKRLAKEKKCRYVVLETQSRNVPAIEFYRKNGFHLIGFDTTCYSNEDVEKKNVRLEFGWEVKGK